MTLGALVLVTVIANEAGQTTSALLPGSLLPAIEGESLTGKRINLPEQAKGKIALLVFTFSRKAGQGARACAEAFQKLEDPERNLAAYRILVLEGVPRLLRGLVIAGIKKGIPAPLHDSAVKLFAHEDSWKLRLGVRSRDDPYLLILDRESQVRWLYTGACDDAGVQQLVEQLKNLASETPGESR
jgi:hypothetical protein